MDGGCVFEMKILQINSPKYGIKDVLLDDEDYEKVIKLRWHLKRCKDNFYVNYTKGKGKNRIAFFLHRFIMNALNSLLEIDHKDKNPLNNQKTNLRLCTRY